MLSKLARVQLIIFTVASVIGAVVMGLNYLQVPRLLGVGYLTVTLDLPASGGLYRFSNVTYRGVQVGKVTDVSVIDGKRVTATMSLNKSPKIPANAVAHVRSVSAIGEQYVDLLPQDNSGPYLVDGSVLRADENALPQQVGPMLDQLNDLLHSIPTDSVSKLLDGSYEAFDGAGYDLGSLLDSADTVASELSSVSGSSRSLIDKSVPLLDGQAASAESLRTWTRSLAGITAQIAQDDLQVRALLDHGPAAAQEVTRLLTQVKPTLPVLLANLASIGQVGVTYHASIEQLLVLLPPNASTIQAFAPSNNATGMAIGDFAISISDPPGCTVGFLPPSQWRSPADTTTVDTPDGLYCKLPQDSPIAVRGARNYPCMGHPGKRAPTVEMCDSDKPYMPLAMRQHALGPYPLDPNLIAQGVPPDDRLSTNDNITGPLAGTPLPGAPGPGAGVPADTEPVLSPGPPTDTSAPPPVTGTPSATPNGYNAADTSAPSVAVVRYDPRTGSYMSPSGQMYAQSNLASSPKDLGDLMMVAGR